MERVVNVHPRRPGSGSLYGPWDMARHLWAHRDLILQLTRREMGQRYRGSYLGVLWSWMTPFLMLATYTFVFAVVLKARWGPGDRGASPPDFALIVFAGLIPFGVFAEVATRAPSLVLAVPNLVKRVVFPLEVLPVAVVGAALVHSLVQVGVLLVGEVLLWGRLSPTVGWLPLVYLPLILLSLGVGWFLAFMGVYIRDIGQVMGILVQILFFTTPIVYPISAVPEPIRTLLYINPLTTLVSGFRRVLLWGDAPPWGPWAGWTGMTAVAAWLGYVGFMKTKKGFADVL